MQHCVKKLATCLPALGLGFTLFTAPVEARPSIASGEVSLETDVAGCLVRADQILKELDIVSSGQGPYHRSGYFNDGAFRILCYDAGENNTLAIMFIAHEESQDVADNFLDFLLSEF